MLASNELKTYGMFNETLYNNPYHQFDLSNYKVLVTGGAGFIGSNIVEYLLRHGAAKVRVLDDLSNGYYSNIELFNDLPAFEFIKGDIRDLDTCKLAVEDMDFVIHEAALGSVPRSIEDPINSNAVNISGFLNMLVAAKDSKTLKRFVYAASSSTYGDSPDLPKVEGNEGNPLSPYAVTKAVNEYYADVFSKVFGFHTVGLRYFNVFGPKQNPDNPYAAVIPIFCKHFLNGTNPTINGDGITSRDFTFVENAVQANIKALQYGVNGLSGRQGNVEPLMQHQVFNTACGEQTSLLEMIDYLKEVSGEQSIEPIFGPERPGDVKHSRASIEEISSHLGYQPTIFFSEGLELVFNWYKENNIL